jgi:hypothetical protein
MKSAQRATEGVQQLLLLMVRIASTTAEEQGHSSLNCLIVQSGGLLSDTPVYHRQHSIGRLGRRQLWVSWGLNSMASNDSF